MSDCFLSALPRYLGRDRRCRRMAMLGTLVAALAVPASSDTVSGQITAVRDADTLVVNHIPIRLNGLDAPETRTTQGRDAREWMVRYLTGKTLRCVLNGQRSYDRYVGICYAEGRDVGAVAVASGHALDCPRFSNGRYRHLETARARISLARAPYC